MSCQILPCKGDYRGACYWHIILFSSTHILEQLLNVLHKGSSLLRRPQETQHATFLDGFASADAKDRGKVLPRIPSLSLQNLKLSVWRALGTMLDMHLPHSAWHDLREHNFEVPKTVWFHTLGQNDNPVLHQKLNQF